MEPLFIDRFENWDDVVSDFGPTEDGRGKEVPTDVEPIIAYYTYEDYNGDAFVLYKQDGVYYEVNGTHCSCYGLENQWHPEEVVPEELANRPGIIYSWYGDDDDFNSRIRERIQAEFPGLTRAA